MVKRSKWSGESVEEMLGLARRRSGVAIAVGRGTDRIDRRGAGWALVASRYS